MSRIRSPRRPLSLVRWLLAACCCFVIELSPLAASAEPANESAKPSPPTYDQSRVGDSDPARIVVPTNQVLSPSGKQVAYWRVGRPIWR